MNARVRLVVVLAALLAASGVPAADDHPLRGQWQVSDPQRPSQSATITFGPTHMEMPGEKPVPYRVEGSGDVLTLIVQGPKRSPPGVISRFPSLPSKVVMRCTRKYASSRSSLSGSSSSSF